MSQADSAGHRPFDAAVRRAGLPAAPLAATRYLDIRASTARHSRQSSRRTENVACAQRRVRSTTRDLRSTTVPVAGFEPAVQQPLPARPDTRSGAVSITKTTPMLNVDARPDLVPYVITVRNSFGADLQDVERRRSDSRPASATSRVGTSSMTSRTEPAVVGRRTDLVGT